MLLFLLLGSKTAKLNNNHDHLEDGVNTVYSEGSLNSFLQTCVNQKSANYYPCHPRILNRQNNVMFKQEQAIYKAAS